ncbi:hypothetical protein BCB4_0109 [Bacillus phage B4]|uniref:Uncharacterized protein n=2 Tax=Bequatrovirus B4 TaxID=1918005 RepID=J9QAH6_9CAUD|nr:hypothetical protein BCB4_0109 [Bacillus phage B4]YP_009783703.1 hypothetical protein QLX26_gp107 [Bacillus phage B5S]AEW47341.1 hypothetical protein B5S_0107 [Bacillus phage B5S]AEZ65902.1 hypothetical protein BCB4_0109 [Bacillus phage B4]
MIQYIKDYIRLFWHINLWGGGITQAELRSTHELAKAANPAYRASIGGTWEHVVHPTHKGYGNRSFWVRKGYRAPSEILIEREEYVDGKLYKVQKKVHERLGGNRMVTEYIK